jgi:hypothetical protein
MHGSEAWTIRKGDTNRLTVCEMKFMRRTAGYKRNEDILTELKIEPMIDYIKHYQESCKSHVNRMSAGRFLKSNFKISTQGEKINRASTEEMDGKLKTVTVLEA